MPIKPHLLKFATALYGATFRVDRSTSLGILICNSLDRNNYNERKLKGGVKYQNLTATFTIFAERWLYLKVGNTLSNENILAVNKFLENYFAEALYIYCSIFTAQEELRYKGYTAAYEKFCKQYDIEIDVDISYDAIRKLHERYRKKLLNAQETTVPEGMLF